MLKKLALSLAMIAALSFIAEVKADEIDKDFTPKDAVTRPDTELKLTDIECEIDLIEEFLNSHKLTPAPERRIVPEISYSDYRCLFPAEAAPLPPADLTKAICLALCTQLIPGATPKTCRKFCKEIGHRGCLGAKKAIGHWCGHAGSEAREYCDFLKGVCKLAGCPDCSER
jgi:hypothetical protein